MKDMMQGGKSEKDIKVERESREEKVKLQGEGGKSKRGRREEAGGRVF